MTLKELFKKDEFSINDFLVIIKRTIIQLKKALLLIIATFFILSVVAYSFDEVTYESKATVLINQSVNNKSNPGLSSLLGVTSPDINRNNIFGPEMYKEIIQSKVFTNELLESLIPFDENKTITGTLEEYLLNFKTKTNFQNLIQKNRKKSPIKIKSKDIPDQLLLDDLPVKKKLTPELVFSNKVPPIVELNPTREALISQIKDNISIENKGNVSSVIVQANDAFISAVMSKLVLEKLIDYITLYKTTKERDNIQYLEDRLKESEQEYQNALIKSASYKDKSYGVIFQSSQTKEQIYNNDVNLKFNLYNQFKTQLEQAKIDLKKETPLFTVLDPITIPSNTSNQSYLLYIIKYLFGAFLCSLILILYKLFTKK